MSKQGLLDITGINKPLPIRIGVTGHKDLESRLQGNTDGSHFASQSVDRRLSIMVDAIMINFDVILAHTPRKYIVVSPLAEGGDMVLTDALLNHRAYPKSELSGQVELQLVAPMPEADYLTEFSSEEQREAYLRLKNQAVNPDQQPLVATGRTPQDRKQAHTLIVNEVVNGCDILVAAWDGIRTDKPAGTFATIERARRLGKPIIYLRPTRSVLRYVEKITLPLLARFHWAKFLFPLFGISIDDSDSVIATLYHLDSFNADLQRQTRGEKGLTLHLRDAAETIAEVDRSYAVLCSDLKKDSPAFEEFETAYESDLKQILLPIWRKTASLARHYRDYDSWVVAAIYWLAASAVVTVSIISSYRPDAHDLYWFEVMEALCVFTIVIASRWFEWHRKRIEYRLLSERLRSAIFLYISGMKIKTILVPAYLKGAYDSSQWAIDIFNSLTEHMQKDTTWPFKFFAEFREWVLQSWIGSQLNYYDTQAKRQQRKFIILERLGLATLGLTVGVAVIHARGLGKLNPVLTVLAFSLPAFGGAMAGILAHREYRRNSHRYRQMSDALDKIIVEAKAAEDASSLQKILHEAHHLMLREHQTWLSTLGVAPPPI